MYRGICVLVRLIMRYYIKEEQINEKTQIITPTTKGEAIYDVVFKSINLLLIYNAVFNPA